MSGWIGLGGIGWDLSQTTTTTRATLAVLITMVYVFLYGILMEITVYDGDIWCKLSASVKSLRGSSLRSLVDLVKSQTTISTGTVSNFKTKITALTLFVKSFLSWPKKSIHLAVFFCDSWRGDLHLPLEDTILVPPALYFQFFKTLWFVTEHLMRWHVVMKACA